MQGRGADVPDPDHHQVGRDRGAVVEPDVVPFDRGQRAADIEYNAVFLVPLAHETAERGPEHMLHRPSLGGDDIDLDIAMAQAAGFRAR